jgi:pimeloyl-ACP methyl ester carboxylesterase
VRGETPLLLIHGRLDNHVPLNHCRRIARSWRGPVDLWEVDGASHAAAISAAPAEFESKVIAYFNRCR